MASRPLAMPSKLKPKINEHKIGNPADHKEIASFEERRRQTMLMHAKSMQSFKSQILMLNKNVIREEPSYWHAGSGDEAGATGETEKTTEYGEGQRLLSDSMEHLSCPAKIHAKTKTTIKDASDHISMTRAIVTLLFNLLLPGLGTILAVLSIKAIQIRDSQSKLSSDSVYRLTVPYSEHCNIIRKRALHLGLL